MKCGLTFLALHSSISSSIKHVGEDSVQLCRQKRSLKYKCCGAINVVLLTKKKKKKSFDKGFYFHCLTATAGPQEPNTIQSDVALNTAENNLTE